MKKYTISACEFVIQENMVWYIPFQFRYLCCYDIKQKKTIEQIAIPISNNTMDLFESVNLYNENIIFIPNHADYILLFNLKEKRFETIPIMPYDERRVGFYANCIYNDYMFFFPKTSIGMEKEYNILGQLNLLTKEIKYINLPCMVKENGFSKKGNHILGREMVCNKNSIYLLNVEAGLLKIDLADDFSAMENCKILLKSNKFSTVCQLNDKVLCMTEHSGFILCYDLEQNEIIYKQTMDNDFLSEHREKGEEGCFSYSIKHEKNVYIFPFETSQVFRLNLEKMILEEAIFSSKICVEKEKRKYCCGQFSKPYIINNRLYVWNIWGNCLCIINLITNEVDKHFVEISIENEELINNYCLYYNKRRYKEENIPCLRIEAMLEYINSSKYNNKLNDYNENHNIADIIWKKISK